MLLKDKQDELFARLSRIMCFPYAPHAALVVAVLLAYANVYANVFLYDDILLIVHNKLLQHWNTLPELLSGLTNSGDGLATGFYRPLQMLFYLVIVQIFGLSPFAFHTLNIGLHAANACLVFGLGSRLGLRQAVSFLAALLWALHPIHTEAVTYISATADPLYSFFCLLGLFVLLPDFAARKFWFASFLFALAIGSKESAVIFPALVVITIFLVSQDRRRFSTYIRTWPLWLLAAAYITLRLIFMHISGFQMLDSQDIVSAQLYVHNLPNRIMTCLATLPVYLGLIIWPSCLHMERSFPIFTSFANWHVLAGSAMILLVTLQIIWGRAQHGLAFSWGCAWFAVALSPNTGLLMPINALLLEHWMYLPTVGMVLGMAYTIQVRLDRHRGRATPMVAFFAALTALAFAVKTYHQNEIWHDPATLFENAFKCGEQSGRAHNVVATFYWRQGEFEKAIEQLQMTVAHPNPLPQSMMPSVYTEFAMVYLRVEYSETDMSIDEQIQMIKRVLPFTSQIPEAIEELNKALEIDPDYFWANEVLAVIYGYQGDGEKAAYYSSRAMTSFQRNSR